MAVVVLALVLLDDTPVPSVRMASVAGSMVRSWAW